MGFEFGSLVFVGVPAEVRAIVLGTVIAKVASREPHQPTAQDFLVEVDERAHTSVRFDRIILDGLDAPTLDIVALLLAQSVCIASFADDLAACRTQLEAGTEHMSRTGRLPRLGSSLMRFIGSAIHGRNQIIAGLAVLDKPSVAWESERHDRLYRKLRAMLEIDERVAALSARLNNTQQTLELFLTVSHSRQNILLEALIVGLIVVDLVIALSH